MNTLTLTLPSDWALLVDLLDRHPLWCTLWLLMIVSPLACRPFTLVTFVRHVYEKIEPRDAPEADGD